MRLVVESAEFAKCIHAVQQHQQPVRLIYASHARWPLPPRLRSNKEIKPDHASDRVRVSVLDSSFNPPTKAHLALSLSGASKASGSKDAASGDADAHLLLLSVRNADKAIKTGDATHEQRLEMMVLLAKELEARLTSEESALPTRSYDREKSKYVEEGEKSREPNVAVGIIDEPTFVRKSAVLREFLDASIASSDSSSASSAPAPTLTQPSTTPAPSPVVQLTFQMGTDTLVRLLDPKYYGPPSSQSESTKLDPSEERRSFMHDALNTFFSDPPKGDGSRVICARRSASSFTVAPGKDWMGGAGEDGEDAEQKEIRVLGGSFYDEGKIKLFSFGEFEMGLSSSGVRKARANGDDWKYMVSAGIAEYIKNRALYLS